MGKALVLFDGWYFVYRIKHRCTSIYLPISQLNSIDISRNPIIETTEGIFDIDYKNFGIEVFSVTTQNCYKKEIKMECEKIYKAIWHGNTSFFQERLIKILQKFHLYLLPTL